MKTNNKENFTLKPLRHMPCPWRHTYTLESLSKRQLKDYIKELQLWSKTTTEYLNHVMMIYFKQFSTDKKDPNVTIFDYKPNHSIAYWIGIKIGNRSTNFQIIFDIDNENNRVKNLEIYYPSIYPMLSSTTINHINKYKEHYLKIIDTFTDKATLLMFRKFFNSLVPLYMVYNQFSELNVKNNVKKFARDIII